MSNQIVLSFSGDSQNLSQTFSQVGADAQRMADDTAVASQRMAENFDNVSSQASLLSGGIGDVGGAMTAAFGEESQLGMIGAEMERYGAIVMGVVGISDLLLFATNNLKLATIAKSVADRTAAAAQWVLNAAQMASPITWIIVGIVALVAVIVLIATKTDWFSRAWRASWDWIKKAAMNTWEFIKKIPGWISTAFSKVSSAITQPFRQAFNMVATGWNRTVGSLSWTVPSWVPVIGGNTISVPHLPTFHSGGIVPGIVGQPVPIMALAGERVSSGRTGGGGAPLPVAAGDALTALIFRIIKDEVEARGGTADVIGITA